MNNSKLIITFVFTALVILVLACTANTEIDIPLIERQTHALNKAIMCPVCPGESIDQSQNPLAVSMRAIVAERLADGQTGDQIKAYFVDKYGPSVLLEPPMEGISLVAWLLPPVAVVVAIFAVFTGLRWMRRTTPTLTSGSGNTPTLTQDEEDSYFQRIESALDLDDVPDDSTNTSDARRPS
jgi:cytochrome c-type biogenesis protein CcmH